MKRRIFLFIVFLILMTNFVIADSAVNKTPGERHTLEISPYILAQLPPIFYGETDLPVGEELTITITKFPVNEQIASASISVLDAKEETKPFFTTHTEGMNKWFYIGNVDDFSFGAYRVNISAISEDISDENIFRIK